MPPVRSCGTVSVGPPGEAVAPVAPVVPGGAVVPAVSVELSPEHAAAPTPTSSATAPASTGRPVRRAGTCAGTGVGTGMVRMVGLTRAPG